LNGQTDFNTITTRDFNSIAVRAGGGSSIYGSSAIGGSIHLNNTINFEEHFSNTLRLNYGSFNTYGGNYKIDASDGKFSVQVSLSRNSSDNDYDYVDADGKNLNGQYYNTSLNAAIGYKINDANFLKLYSQVFEGERHFSLIFPSEIRTKYQDLNTRNLLEWNSFFGKFVSKVKFAALSEKYKYFGNISSNAYTFGQVRTYIGKYDLAFDSGNAIKLNAVVDFTQNKGEGSDIKNEQRNIGSASLLFKHKLTQKILYELSVRKELTNNYKSPFLFSLGTKWAASDFYTLKLNGSKNFRVPTFNDLYWQPGGNENLKPESSYQAEIGNEFRFAGFQLTLTGYYIDIKDMLRWIPNGSVWSPQNTYKVRTYGGEALLTWSKNFGNHHLLLNGTYAYTVSEDMEKKKQLIYVPYHKATSSLSYSWKKLAVDYQCLYNGEVFTRSDNNSRYNIDAYFVSNASVSYDFGNKNSRIVGFQVLNLLNENYASVESRFLPGRNFNMYLTLNF
jgi:vitamin B12 transporter